MGIKVFVLQSVAVVTACGSTDVPDSSEKSGILIETSNPSPSCTQINSFHWESYGFASRNKKRFISIFEGLYRRDGGCS